MDVYYDGNIRRNGRRGTRLTELPLNRTFLWESQEIFIPAIYIGRAGAVLDVCAKIPTEDMAAFLKKWDQKRRLSLQTMEDYEQIDADNPGSRAFALDASLDDTPLTRRSYSSINWYPEEVFSMSGANPARAEEWENDMSAEAMMEAYGCDRKSCWHLSRHLYDWSDIPLLSPQKISLTFRANPIPVNVGHFTTFAENQDSGLFHALPENAEPSAACSGNTIKAIHPMTGEEYTLTLHGFELTRHSFADIGAKDIVYPEYCRILSYQIYPEINPDLFDVRDCAEGDQPRKADAREASGKSDGATAVFAAMKAPGPHTRQAASFMHFKPVQKVRWRMVFLVTPKHDTTVFFPV